MDNVDEYNDGDDDDDDCKNGGWSPEDDSPRIMFLFDIGMVK